MDVAVVSVVGGVFVVVGGGGGGGGGATGRSEGVDVESGFGEAAVGREGGAGRFAAVGAVADGRVDGGCGEGVLDGFAEAGACGERFLGRCRWRWVFGRHGLVRFILKSFRFALTVKGFEICSRSTMMGKELKKRMAIGGG